MKLKLEDVQAAHSVIDCVVASPVLESSQFVRLKQDGNSLTLSLTGTLWTSATVKSKEPGGKWTAYVDRRVLKPFLSTATGADLEVFYKDKLTLKSGQRLEIPAHAVITGYEAWTPKQAYDLPDDQMTALRTYVKYLPNVAGSEHVEAVCFLKGYGMVSTDTLFMAAVLGTEVKNDFFLPAALANVLASTGGKIAADAAGVGAAFPNGFAYQPLSADLERYPVNSCKAAIDGAVKAPALARMLASNLAPAMAVASQFLIDKQESATVSPYTGKSLTVNSGLQIAVDCGAGKFQRVVPLIGKCEMREPVTWSVKKLQPWLDYAAASRADCVVEFAKLPNASALRFVDGKRKSVILFADL